MKTLAKIIVGSQMFGTATETSDVDIIEIYMCSIEELLSLEYQDQIDITKDHKKYELGKFMKLLTKSNPGILEILFAPEDCILESSPEWEHIRHFKKEFVTKDIYNTFCGYANTQISKARGTNKYINWEKDATERKTIHDFSFILEGRDTIPYKEWLLANNIQNHQIGLSKLDNFRDGYIFYIGDNLGGIGEDYSNQVRVRELPKGIEPKGFFTFNRDSYAKHCKRYLSYKTWIEERNENRYETNKSHGQNYDGKNIAHMQRLLNVVQEALITGIIRPRRTAKEAKKLLDIKHGKVNLEAIVNNVETQTLKIKRLLEKSKLQDTVDQALVNQLLLWTRFKGYKIPTKIEL